MDPAVPEPFQLEAVAIPPQVQEARQPAMPKRWRFPAFAILIWANVVVFYAMLFHNIYLSGTEAFLKQYFGAAFDSSLLLRWGANYGLLTLTGQFWRVITSNFVHANFVHLLLNVAFLWWLGEAVERLLGSARTMAIYFLTGMASSLLSLSWHPTLISCGASGAVYGFAGVLLPLLAFAKLGLPWLRIISPLTAMTLIIPFSLLSGHPVKSIDYRAHLGGFIGGLLIGACLVWAFRSSPEQRQSRQRRILVMAGGIMPVLFVMVMIMRSDVIDFHRGELALVRMDPSAITLIKRFVDRNPDNVTGHADLAFAYLFTGKRKEEAQELEQILRIEPDNYDTQYRLAVLYTSGLMRPKDAIPLYKQSIPKIGETSEKYENFALALLLSDHLQEAEDNARKAVALDPKDKNAHSLLSDLLRLEGKSDESAREKALAEEPPPSQHK